MELDELKKIWDSQKDQPMYNFNESALHSHIAHKHQQGMYITNSSELLIIVANITAACFIVGLNLLKQNENVFVYFIAAWMFLTAVYMLMSRVRRIKTDNRFDQSLRGTLNHALFVARYQVHLGQIMRWNILPLATLVLLGVWEGGKSIWFSVGIVIFFVLTHFAAGWEQGIYKNRKLALEKLKHKLESEE